MENELVYKRKLSQYSSHELILGMIDQNIDMIKSKALDLGSSDGILTDSLLQKNITSTCVDLVPPEDVKAKCERYYQINLENYDQLEFDHKFDYIILADSIEHIRNADKLMSYITKFLKVDGKVIVSVPNVVVWVYRILFLLGKFDYTEKGTLDETHVRFYTKKTIKNLLISSGFKITKIKPTGLPFEVVFPSMKGSFILRTVDRFYYFLAKIWPEMFAYQFVVECQQKQKGTKGTA